ncbi:MAG: hypothetical protein P4L59_15495 [Desulfosporosinus sp.]|nr:hypothetical protein [Desulfosporosinus sp.]
MRVLLIEAEPEKQILNLFKIHRNKGGAAVITTYSKALAAHADRIIRLVDGGWSVMTELVRVANVGKNYTR